MAARGLMPLPPADQVAVLYQLSIDGDAAVVTAAKATAAGLPDRLLAGTLGGAAMGRDVIDFNHDDDSVTNTGQAIAAINIAAFGDVATFKAAVDTLVRDFRGSARMPGVARIFVPGERSHATREARRRDGIPIAPALMRA